MAAGADSAAAAGLPEGVDPQLWFVSSTPVCAGGRDYLYDASWHTFPGRMAAWCPHDPDHPCYRISLAELPDDLPAETRYWVAGFLAGNLPAPPDSVEAAPEMRAWEAAAERFRVTGYWRLED